MKSYLKLTLISIAILIASLSSNTAFAQDPTAKKTYHAWSIALKAAYNRPFTDVRQYDFFAITKPKSEIAFSGELEVKKMFSSAFGAIGYVSYGKLQGVSSTRGDTSMPDYRRRPWKLLGLDAPAYFSSPLLVVGGGMYINWSNLAMLMAKANQKPESERRIAFFSEASIGYLFYNGQIRDIGTDTAYRKYLKGTSHNATDLEFDASIGVKYKIKNNIDIGFEFVMHNVNSDKLDGYDSKYVTQSQIINNTTSISPNPFQKVGAPGKDKYGQAKLGITYHLGCPDESNVPIEWNDPTEQMYDEYEFLADKMRKMATDSDGDGVADIFDQEPSTPKGNRVDGAGKTLDLGGYATKKSLDSLGKALGDAIKKIPTTNTGGNTNTTTVLGGMGIIPSVYFDVNMSEIKPQYLGTISDVAKMLKGNNALKVTITGSADETSTTEYNQQLGLRRAQAVADYLIKYFTIDASRITTKSVGEGQPISKLLAPNRRADLDVK